MKTRSKIYKSTLDIIKENLFKHIRIKIKSWPLLILMKRISDSEHNKLQRNVLFLLRKLAERIRKCHAYQYFAYSSPAPPKKRAIKLSE